MARTPTPWSVGAGPAPERMPALCGANHTKENPEHVVWGCGCCGSPDLSGDDAEFIVKACNAHSALLVAAKALKAAMKSRSATATEYDALDKAIALAEGGKDGAK